MSSNGSKRHDGATQRAAAARIARQVNRDQQVRPPPSISLPRLRCLEQALDGEAPERAA